MNFKKCIKRSLAYVHGYTLVLEGPTVEAKAECGSRKIVTSALGGRLLGPCWDGDGTQYSRYAVRTTCGRAPPRRDDVKCEMRWLMMNDGRLSFVARRPHIQVTSGSHHDVVVVVENDASILVMIMTESWAVCWLGRIRRFCAVYELDWNFSGDLARTFRSNGR